MSNSMWGEVLEFMNKKRKIAIILSAIAYPFSYIIATILWHVTMRLDGLYPGIIPVASMNVSIISLMVTFNMIAVIYAFSKGEK